MVKFSLIFFILFLMQSNAFSELRSLKNNKVNVRLGPAKNYPIKFIYEIKYLPVIIIDHHYNWRKIKDYENDSGWVHISQLSKTKTAITIKNNKVIFSSPSIYSKPKAKLKIHQVLIIKNVIIFGARLKILRSMDGLKKEYLWGIKEDKISKK